MSKSASYVKHLVFWLLTIVGAPALLFLGLMLIPGGQLLAVVVAFYFYAGPAAIVGHPHFAGEYGFPDTTLAYWIICSFWVAVVVLFTMGSVWFTSRSSADRLQRPLR
jgi:hypothetical protein